MESLPARSAPPQLTPIALVDEFRIERPASWRWTLRRLDLIGLHRPDYTRQAERESVNPPALQRRLKGRARARHGVSSGSSGLIAPSMANASKATYR